MEEGKQTYTRRAIKQGQQRLTLKQSFRENFMKEWGKDINSKIKFGEHFLERPLDGEPRVYLPAAEAEAGRWRKEKGVPHRRIRMESTEGGPWGMMFKAPPIPVTLLLS